MAPFENPLDASEEKYKNKSERKNKCKCGKES